MNSNATLLAFVCKRTLTDQEQQANAQKDTRLYYEAHITEVRPNGKSESHAISKEANRRQIMVQFLWKSEIKKTNTDKCGQDKLLLLTHQQSMYIFCKFVGICVIYEFHFRYSTIYMHC